MMRVSKRLAILTLSSLGAIAPVAGSDGGGPLGINSCLNRGDQGIWKRSK
jgi:hypothetical protein